MERKPRNDATDLAPGPAPRPKDERPKDEREARDREAREKARAYVDLWERHVVLTALHGPDTSWRPAKS